MHNLFLLLLSSNHNDDNLLKSVFCNRSAAINNVWTAFANYVENWLLMLYYHLLCIVSAYLLILYISVSLSVLLPNVANKRVHWAPPSPAKCRHGDELPRNGPSSASLPSAYAKSSSSYLSPKALFYMWTAPKIDLWWSFSNVLKCQKDQFNKIVVGVRSDQLICSFESLALVSVTAYWQRSEI